MVEKTLILKQISGMLCLLNSYSKFTQPMGNRILHIVAGCDTINIYIITAYYPDTKKFEADLKTRRKG